MIGVSVFAVVHTTIVTVMTVVSAEMDTVTHCNVDAQS